MHSTALKSNNMARDLVMALSPAITDLPASVAVDFDVTDFDFTIFVGC